MTKRYDVELRLEMEKFKWNLPLEEAVQELIDMAEVMKEILPDWHMKSMIPIVTEVQT